MWFRKNKKTLEVKIPSMSQLGLEDIISFHKDLHVSYGTTQSRHFYPEEYHEKTNFFRGTSLELQSANQIQLPSPKAVETPLQEVLLKRKTSRPHASHSVTLEELSTLLRLSLGKRSPDNTKRTYPSAGGLYPIEVFAFLKKVEDIPDDTMVHYQAETHCLEVVEDSRVIIEALKKSAGYLGLNEHLSLVPVVLFLTTQINKMALKYRERSYLFSLLESGHIGQNIYLVGTAMNLQICAIGETREEIVIQNYFNNIMQDMFCTYILTIGKEAH